MPGTIIARRSDSLTAHIVSARDMTYSGGPDEARDKPPHVRAASGLTAFKRYLAIVQDDANWLALVDRDDRIFALPLPPHPESGERVFSEARGNKKDKFDLEACVSMPGKDGPELIGFGSGSHPGKEWLLRVHESEDLETDLRENAAVAELEIELKAEFLNVERFYDSMRRNTDFCGCGLNIEGAVPLEDGTIRLFQRGNAPEGNGLKAVDATGDISWAELVAHLVDPDGCPPPEITNIRRYDLGALDGVRLTFSDAEHLGGGRVLYSASAEDPDSGEIMGSALGVIEPDGEACWTEVSDRDGGRFEGKIEGLTSHPEGQDHVRFVIDDDDETVPSKLFEARLNEGFLDPARA